MRNLEKALIVIQRTHDGGDLTPKHLKLTEIAVNGMLSGFGQQEFDRLYEQVINGNYVQPYLHGVEHVTVDRNGYIYWKGINVEHFDYPYEMNKETEFFGKLCRQIEADGKEVSWATYMDYCAKNNYRLD